MDTRPRKSNSIQINNSEVPATRLADGRLTRQYLVQRTEQHGLPLHLHMCCARVFGQTKDAVGGKVRIRAHNVVVEHHCSAFRDSSHENQQPTTASVASDTPARAKYFTTDTKFCMMLPVRRPVSEI